MSDYSLENRQEVSNVLLERVISNAPVRELLRVYSEAVTAALQGLSDADLVRSVVAAGYTDILEAFNIEAPEASEEAPAEEEATPVEGVPA